MYRAGTSTSGGEVVLSLVTEYESKAMAGWQDSVYCLEFHHHGNLLAGDYSLRIVASGMISHVHCRMAQAHSCLCVLHFNEYLSSVESWHSEEMEGGQSRDVEAFLGIYVRAVDNYRLASSNHRRTASDE